MANQRHKEKKGSATKLFSEGSMRKIKRSDKTERKQVTLLLASNKRVKLIHDRKASHDEKKKKFIQRYASTDEIKSKIGKFASKYKLNIDAIVDEIGMVYLSGTIKNLEKAFNVELHKFEYKNESKRHNQHIDGHEGNYHLPEDIHSIVSGVIGLSHIPLEHYAPDSNTLEQDKFFSAAVGLNPTWFTEHYKFPKPYKGKGQKIAIISCGGGITKSNIKHYFNALGIEDYPQVKFVSVDGSKNSPGSNFSYDFELATDCLVAMTAAPESKIEIYSTINSIKGFSDAILKICKSRTGGPKVVSYSWGTKESHYSDTEIESVNRILKFATLVKGITILCASGDAGSTNNYNSDEDSPLEVQYPASSPWITACGGTKINTNEKGKVMSEVAWNSQYNLYDILIQNASGGGFSRMNSRPTYQKKWLSSSTAKYPKKGRGVPDISAHADMSPGGIGYWIRVDGKYWVGGGTSAVAPLMAALVARLNQACKESLGFLNPLLYEMASKDAITSINKGTNAMRNGPKQWSARKGWDPCTGLGIPNGVKMLKFLKQRLKN